jgi:two-component sensor histidine kinase
LDITEKRQWQDRVAADLRATETLRAVAAECVRDDVVFESCVGKVLDAAIAIAGAKKGNFQLFNQASGSLRIVAQRGFHKEFLDFFNSVDNDAAASCAAAMKSGCPVVVRDVSISEIFAGQTSLRILAAEGVRAVVSVPLSSSRNSVLGMISTHFLEPHEADARELRLLELLARIAGDYLQRRESEKTERMLRREVEHRSSNLLALVQALARNSGNDRETFETRLDALARSNQRIITAKDGQMSILDSVSVQLGPFATRITAQGPNRVITAQQAQSISLVIHELVTNAVKYGSLSNQSGTVGIVWDQRGAQLTLTWKEQGGPKVVKPARTGFGTKLITRLFPNVKLDYASDGLYCQIELQLDA